MGWRSLESQSKIIKTMDYVMLNKEDITVKIPRENTTFTTRLVNVKSTDDLAGESRHFEIFIEALQPEEGNDLMSSSPFVDLEFKVTGNRHRCRTKYLGAYGPPHRGLIIELPESIEIEEKRRDERRVYELPDFVSAEVSIPSESNSPKTFDLPVLDCSRHGLGMVVTQDNFDLIDLLHVGDPLEDISFYASWAIVKVDGMVKHITPIHEGQYEGGYVIGLESQELIDNCGG